MTQRNPNWSREELILALDLYFRLGPGRFSAADPEVISLSEVLNSLPLHSMRPDAQRFRNPNGVNMKLCNFLRLDPSYRGKGLQRGAKLEEGIWAEFASNRERLSAHAAEIRRTARKDL